MVRRMDMSWPVDVKPKQEIEDCGNKVGKRLFTWHFCRSKAVAKSCGYWFRHVKHDHKGALWLGR